MANLQNIEIELKFPLENQDQVISFLKENARHTTINEYQKDTYYIPSHRNFLQQTPISEWLRLRKTKNKSSINYKNWHNKNGQKTVSCDECESKIENLESLENILKSLDMKEIVIVEKTRNSWIYDQCEISIDTISNLGIFIEFESKGDFESIEDAKKYLYNNINKINAKVGEQIYTGYPYMILERDNLI